MSGLEAETAVAAEPADAAAPAASDQENADPADEGSLRKMFVQGSHDIATHRTDNLFHNLEQRTLTDEEQNIIKQRVALQRKMFEEYERRERKRKVAELQEVCPDISEEEAHKALEMCDGREDEAAAQLVTDAAFKRKVQAACGLAAVPAGAAAAPARKEAGSSRRDTRHGKANGPRPKLIDPATLAGNVFVGAFRGKGFKPPLKGRAPARKAATAAVAAASCGSGEEEGVQEGDKRETEEDTETEDEGGEEDTREGSQQQQQQQPVDGGEEQEEEQRQHQQSPEDAAAHPQEEVEQQRQQHQAGKAEQEVEAFTAATWAPQQHQQASSVLVWPSAAAAAARVDGTPAAAVAQRYVLVKADTLEEPTDSVLRSARRQLGQASDSRAATGAEEERAAPASAARSRPPAGTPSSPRAALLAPSAGAAGEPAPLAAAAATAPLPPAVMPSSAVVAAMAKQLTKQDDSKARALLLHMPNDAVRAAVLERLESMDAVRAAACHTLLAAPAGVVQPAEPAGGVDRAEAAAGGAEQQQAATQQQQQEQPGTVVSVQRGRSRRAAAGASRAAKRAASLDVPQDEEAEADEEQTSAASSESEAGMAGQESSSDDDFAAPTAIARRNRRAPIEAAKPRAARPTRAAKQAATATLAALAEAGGHGSDAEMAVAAASASSDEEQQQPRRRTVAKVGGRAFSGATASKAKRALCSPPVAATAMEDEGEGTDARRKGPAIKRQRLQQGQAAAAKAEQQQQEEDPPAVASGADAFGVAAALTAAAQASGDPAAAHVTSQQPSVQQRQGRSSEQQGLQRGASRRASPGAAEASDDGEGSRPQPHVRAISSTGHTCRGRVRQKSHKSADLVQEGKLRAEKGWYNAGYIFAEGFQSRTLFRSSVAIDQLCVHECHIIGKDGQHWPQPTFKVVALDRPDEPLIAKSCTGCWTGILKRINAEIEARRKAGEGLPPPPKTAIAGPEYFGLNQPNIQEAVEALDPEHLCTEYWAGKQDRQRAAAGLPVAAGPAARAPRAPRQSGNSSRRHVGNVSGGKVRGRRHGSDSEDDDGEHGEGEEDETQFMTNKWSAVSRSDRYRKRLQENGDDTSKMDEDNPLPHFIDPITMGAVVRPAISPYGYVAGLATWKVMLAEKQQCPFTNTPLQFEQLKVLTKTNIHLHKDKIVNGSTA